MNTGMLLALALGTVVPALTAVITKANASPRLKALLSAMLAALAGGLSGAYQQPPKALSQWEQIGLTILLAWVAAGVAYLTGWKPTGAARALARATARIGVGAPESTPETGQIVLVVMLAGAVASWTVGALLSGPTLLGVVVALVLAVLTVVASAHSMRGLRTPGGIRGESAFAAPLRPDLRELLATRRAEGHSPTELVPAGRTSGL